MRTMPRVVVMLAGLVGIGAVYVAATLHIPAQGRYRGPYGMVVNAVATRERHVTNAVSAVNFDYRGVDTVGEEFVLVVAVAGVTVVLRRTREESEDSVRERRDQDVSRSLPPTSDAVRIAALVQVALVVVLGVYIVAHGQLTPGGGFQGGVILASGLLLVYLAGRYRLLRRIGPVAFADIMEAVGAGGFVLVGVTTLATGAAFLANLLPLGTTGLLDSGGTISVINALIGLEVCGGILVAASEFLEQALEIREARRA